MKIAFLLMSQKGSAVLQAFFNRFGSDLIDCVVTARDKTVEKDYFEDIASLCRDNNVSCCEREDGYRIKADYVFAISWRWMEAFPAGKLIVLHDSLLPRYRGFAPLVSALINGDREIGVTALLGSDCYDAGDLILQKKIQVKYPAKIHEVIERVAPLYSDIVVEICETLFEGRELPVLPTDPAAISYSLWRDERDYAIDWSGDAARIVRFVDATGFPYKGASSYVNGTKVRIINCVEVEDVKIENRSPGKIIFVHDGVPTVVCGSGLVKVTNMKNNESGEEMLPITRFRSRFE